MTFRIVVHSPNLRVLDLVDVHVSGHESAFLPYPLYTAPVLLPPHKLYHLTYKITRDPASVHFFASLLSTNTITHLYLTDQSEPESRAYLDDSLLPILIRHAPTLQEFTFTSHLDFPDGGEPMSWEFSFHLNKVLPLLVNCTHLTIPAYSLSYPADDPSSVLIDPSSFPLLSHLRIPDIERYIDDAVTMWEPLVRARGGTTLIDVEFEIDGLHESGTLWAPLATLCLERGVKLHFFRGTDINWNEAY